MDKLLCRYADKKITPHIESISVTPSTRAVQLHHCFGNTVPLVDDEKRELYPKLRQADGRWLLHTGDYFAETAKERLN